MTAIYQPGVVVPQHEHVHVSLEERVDRLGTCVDDGLVLVERGAECDEDVRQLRELLMSR